MPPFYFHEIYNRYRKQNNTVGSSNFSDWLCILKAFFTSLVESWVEPFERGLAEPSRLNVVWLSRAVWTWFVRVFLSLSHSHRHSFTSAETHDPTPNCAHIHNFFSASRVHFSLAWMNSITTQFRLHFQAKNNFSKQLSVAKQEKQFLARWFNISSSAIVCQHNKIRGNTFGTTLVFYCFILVGIIIILIHIYSCYQKNNAIAD